MAKKKRRKLSKAQARTEARRRKRQQRIVWAVAGIVVVAVIVVVALIALSGGGDVGELVEAEPLRSDIETGVTAEGYPYRGSADAPATLVEYSDYNCPHCRDFALETAPLIDEELVATGQLKYVVQPYALWDFSLPIAEAAACARDQGRFWEFHHWTFANSERFPVQQPPSRDMLRQLAGASGLDVGEFDACLDQGRTRDEVRASKADAETRLGVNSTPTIYVNGVNTPASLEAIRSAVQAAASGG